MALSIQSEWTGKAIMRKILGDIALTVVCVVAVNVVWNWLF